ncbi:Holliday junction resolvase RuvX [Sphingobacteriales bacterium UPWRP_1]|nr:Holliday junction resolvase RuvX [Sphingobacteriales bacterium TSM_CSM]PSJ75178.1 Holliday junction resolvase RuvX [Sphingobacteriales bacterium UPWRP_1]
MGRIVAIDFGLKRSGIAVTDELKITANGLTTLDTPALLLFLKNYVAAEPVEIIVVGEPLNLNGTETHATQAANKLVQELQKLFPQIPVEREDETYTSKMAMQTLVTLGVSKKKRRNKKLIDKVSATLILQSFLQRKGIW